MCLASISTAWISWRPVHGRPWPMGSTVLRSGSPLCCAEEKSALELRLEQLEQRVRVLESVAPAAFSVLHWNVLADAYASNMQPWFLYGAGVTEEERSALSERFYERDAKTVRGPRTSLEECRDCDEGVYLTAFAPLAAAGTLCEQGLAVVGRSAALSRTACGRRSVRRRDVRVGRAA
eukprot:4763053-Prymnesium_polylepis.1